MRKLLLFLILCPSAFAQYAASNATVTATITDSDGTVWANGRWSLRFNPSNQASIFRIGGLPLDPAVLAQSGTIDGSGDISIDVYKNTSIVPSPSTTNWSLSICPNATGGCGTYSFFLNSASVDLSGGITSVIPAPRFKAVAGTYGYNDTEAALNLANGAEYVNVTTPCLRFYSSGWICLGAAAPPTPTGILAFVASGTCPSGWTEDTALDGNYVLSTTHAHGDVGTTGGSSSYTPTGTVTASTFTGTPATLTGSVAAPTFTGVSATLTGSVAAPSFLGTLATLTGSVTAPAFTGSSANVSFGSISFAGSGGTTGATSGGTPAGTNTLGAFTEGVITWPVGVPAFNGSAGTVPAQIFTGTPFSSVINHTHTVTTTWNVQGGTSASTTGVHVMTSTATGGTARVPTTGDVISATTANPAGGVSSITPAGSNGTVSFTPTGTNAWPVGVPTIAAGSFTQPTFTGALLGTHTHSYTPAGTVTIGTSTVTATGTNSVPSLTMNSYTPVGTNSAPALTMNAYVPAGSLSVPALMMNSYTPVGTNSVPTFSGTPATLTPVFYKLIPCVKN